MTNSTNRDQNDGWLVRPEMSLKFHAFTHFDQGRPGSSTFLPISGKNYKRRICGKAENSKSAQCNRPDESDMIVVSSFHTTWMLLKPMEDCINKTVERVAIILAVSVLRLNRRSWNV